MRRKRTHGGSPRARWACFALCGSLGAGGCNSLLGIEIAGLDTPRLTDAGAPAASRLPAARADAGVSPGASPPAPAGAATPAEVPAAAVEGPAPSAPTTPPVLPSADAGVAEPVPVGPPLGSDGLAVALPNDLIGAPVSGEITFSEEASWEVDGVFQPTFEIHTPTGSYWIVKNLGSMVSMQDAYAGRAQWIDFSSGFRPLRNIPALATPPAGVSTQLDRESQTPTHLRLTSVSADQAWHWVWDFYITHATLTINRAPVPIGFSYRGVPAGALGTEDQLIQSDGTTQGARNSFSGEVPGPVEWVYIADTTAGRSLFLMQHTDDALPESYQVRDNDSAAWSFGDGLVTRLPVRFSLGLVDSVAHAVVSQRVQFVAGVIH
jgi:hypothetical protein